VLGEGEDFAGGEVLEGGLGLEGDAEAGEALDAVEEVGVEGEAVGGEGQERGRVVGIEGGEHAGGGGGGVGEGGVALEDGDPVAAGVEFESEREADDAGAGDEDVGGLVGRGHALDSLSGGLFADRLLATQLSAISYQLPVCQLLVLLTVLSCEV
jgi:hypothetical protein